MTNNMDIVVSDTDGKNEKRYTYSNQNWRNHYACMDGPLVVMWAPKEVSKNGYVITSGRRWTLKPRKV